MGKNELIFSLNFPLSIGTAMHVNDGFPKMKYEQLRVSTQGLFSTIFSISNIPTEFKITLKAMFMINYTLRLNIRFINWRKLVQVASKFRLMKQKQIVYNISY